MLARTHLVITLFLILMFFSSSSNFVFFLFVALFATLLPDIDTRFSKIGKHFKIFNFFTKHRGIIHSFTLLLTISIFILLFFKEILIPFVIGYASHLLVDCMTIQGTRLFYPFKIKIRGKLRTNGLFEKILFLLFGFIDVLLIVNRIFSIS